VNIFSDAIKQGSISMLFRFAPLTDLTGATDGPVTLTSLAGIPEMPSGSPTYDGSNDLDWWYAVDSSVSSTTLSGALTGNVLTTLPGSMNGVWGVEGATPSPVHASNMTLTGALRTVNTPAESTTSAPPGHVPSENMDPNVQSFSTVVGGDLCMSLSAASLAVIPIPGALTGTNCAQGYTPSSSVLDLYTLGCTYFSVPIIPATAPDQVDPAMPIPSGTAPFTLSASSGTHVDTCKDSGGNVTDFATCASYLAYSSYFQFTADRVIIRP
jgi:hypothetical protein